MLVYHDGWLSRCTRDKACSEELECKEIARRGVTVLPCSKSFPRIFTETSGEVRPHGVGARSDQLHAASKQQRNLGEAQATQKNAPASMLRMCHTSRPLVLLIAARAL
jgi:hypothetical protein